MTEPAMESIRYYELPTNDAPIKFDGEFIDSLDNGGGDRLRWAELQLYDWYPHGEDIRGYVLYTVGHSLVYHRLGAECNKGEVTAVRDFPQVTGEDPDDLVPCPDCEPPDWLALPGEQELELEVTWYKWASCRTAKDLLAALQREPKCKNCFHRRHGPVCYCKCDDYQQTAPSLSTPGRRLLAQVMRKRKDPAIAAAMRDMEIRL